jgi:hypothetical protein
MPQKGTAFSALLGVILALSVLVSCAKPAPVQTPQQAEETPAIQETPIAQATTTPSPAPDATPTQAVSPSPTPTPTAAAPREAVPFDGQPLSSFFVSHFVGSGTCAFCHSDLVDDNGNDVSIDTHWRSTMMANAAADPLWQAKVSSEGKRNPALKDVIEEKCATCHMPMAYTQAGSDGQASAILDGGFLSADHPLSEAAMDGVSCTLCHQIQDVGLGEKESFSGGYVIDTTLTPPDRVAFGPFPDPLQPQMQMHVGFIPVEGPHTLDAGLCATCHTLYTPYVDATGEVAGVFPEQVAYLEWEHSAYGDGADWDISCQQCHMPAAKGGVVISNRPAGRMIEPRSPFAQHHFAGGNVFMLRVFKTYGEELGLTAGTAHLDDTLARTLARLEGGTAKLDIDSARIEDDKLTIVLDVTSIAGHKLPTGFPSRRVWIHLVVTDGNGETLFESGQPQVNGSIAGSDADQDPSAYEPHYDLIANADQVQIYESVMQDSEGAVTYTLLRGAAYVKDNRLLPSGFDKASAGEDIAVRGSAASDETFVGGSDRITYQIELKGREGPYTVSARLLYQTVSYRFASDLFQDDGPLVERMAGYYGSADHTPVVVADDQKTVR